MLWPGLARQIEAELLESAQWYEDQRPGLGDELLDAILDLLSRVHESPRLFPEVHGDVRRAVLTKRFQFSVYFRERASAVEVLAILHNARDPEEWKRRL